MNAPILCPACDHPAKASAQFGEGDRLTLALRCARCGDLVLSGAAIAVGELAHHSTRARVARRVAGWRRQASRTSLVLDPTELVDDPEALQRGDEVFAANAWRLHSVPPVEPCGG